MWLSITYQLLFGKSWLTPRLKAIKLLFLEKYVLLPNIAYFFADVSVFSDYFCKISTNYVMWRHGRSSDQIFTKLTQSDIHVHILLVSKYEVICICFRKVMTTKIFWLFITDIREYRKTSLPTSHKTPIKFFLHEVWTPNFQE